MGKESCGQKRIKEKKKTRRFYCTQTKKYIQHNLICCPNKAFCLNNQNLTDLAIDLTKLFSQCILQYNNII